jgi:hypothetical protein
MPICLVPACHRGKDHLRDEIPDWPEPPGYLGEAVRRAKRISGQSPPPRCDNRPED